MKSIVRAASTCPITKLALAATFGLAYLFTLSCGQHSWEEILGLDSSSSLQYSSSSEEEDYSSSSFKLSSSSSSLQQSSSSSAVAKVSSSSLQQSSSSSSVAKMRSSSLQQSSSSSSVAKVSSSSLQQDGNETGDWDIKVLDVARDVDYLTDIEKDVVLELNMVRSNPKKYAELYIQPMLKYFNENKYSEPGKTTVITQEGAASVQECIEELSQAASIGILTFEKGLYLAAKDHTEDQGKTGNTGHEGSDGSKLRDRVNRYGNAGALGETISYAKNTGRSIVIQLLVDDGVPSRGHRNIIMNGSYTQVGSSVGTHSRYGNMCVTVYAKGYKSD